MLTKEPFWLQTAKDTYPCAPLRVEASVECAGPNYDLQFVVRGEPAANLPDICQVALIGVVGECNGELVSTGRDVGARNSRAGSKKGLVNATFCDHEEKTYILYLVVSLTKSASKQPPSSQSEDSSSSGRLGRLSSAFAASQWSRHIHSGWLGGQEKDCSTLLL